MRIRLAKKILKNPSRYSFGKFIDALLELTNERRISGTSRKCWKIVREEPEGKPE